MTHGTQQEDANALQEKGPRDTVELCITGTEAPDFPEGQAQHQSVPQATCSSDSLTGMCLG